MVTFINPLKFMSLFSTLLLCLSFSNNAQALDWKMPPDTLVPNNEASS